MATFDENRTRAKIEDAAACIQELIREEQQRPLNRGEHLQFVYAVEAGFFALVDLVGHGAATPEQEQEVNAFIARYGPQTPNPQ